MKYATTQNTGIILRKIKAMKLGKASSIPVKQVSMKAANQIAKHKNLGLAIAISCPTLLKNLPSLYDVGFKKLTIIAGKTIEKSKKILLSIICPHSTIAANRAKKDRFHFLLVVQKFLSVMMKNFLKSNSIIPWIKGKFKEILVFLSVLLYMGNSYASIPEAQNLAKIIYNAEKKYDIPEGLLFTIAQVESKLNPWAININSTNKALYPSSKEQAARITRILLRNGMNFDVGVMQINWKYHGKEFDSIESMFSPETNIEYAAKFLRSLHNQYGSWNQAVRRYHSATKELHEPYAKKILVTWVQSW
ncbi:MAG: putative transglycosylase-putative [Rickettsiaceae bacterium]|jgi:hypothetical protein|nr:putative transglycosylase-putative [Rickettsiaceae bacterium]